MKGALKDTLTVFNCVMDYYFFDKEKYHWCVDYHENGGPINQMDSVKHLTEDSSFNGVRVLFNYHEYE